MKDKTCSVSLLEPPQPCTKKAKALKEYKFKEKKKRRKLRPVSDKRTEVYVVAKPRIPFGATVYYSPRPNSDDPQIVLCELSIDGKHAGRWLLRAGERREAASVSRFSDEQDENTDGPSLRCFGTVEVIFWRVMCPFSSDGTLDDEYVPDEGLPAVSVFSFLYRDMGWLLENGVLTSEKPAKEPSVLTSDVSYERDSDVGSVFRSPAMMSCDFPRFQHKASISHILSSEPGPVIGKLDRRRIFVETNSKSGFVSLDQDLSVESLNKGVLRLLTYWGLNAPVGSFEVVLSSGVYHRSSITKEDLHSICGIRLLV